MKTALIVLAGVLLRDAWCWATAKVWCWRRRRQAQREAKENRELREIAAKLDALENERAKRIVPYPQLLKGPLVVSARNDDDYILFCRQMHANFVSQRKLISTANFEEN
jgi:hypothetical protein